MFDPGRFLPGAEMPARFSYLVRAATGFLVMFMQAGFALVETGLLIAPEDGGAPYDRFRGRIIFPIADGRGRLVSFGGRALRMAGLWVI